MFALNQNILTNKTGPNLFLKAPVVIVCALAMLVLSFKLNIVGENHYQNAAIAFDVAGLDEDDPQDIDPGFPANEFFSPHEFSDSSPSLHYVQPFIVADLGFTLFIRGPPVLI